jgi:pimeloyl-ACP methyl ester carboxylesterase
MPTLCEGPAMTQFATASDNVRLAYETVGEGEPIMLVHGFGSSRVQNWRDTGWYKTLNDAGYGVTAMDCRGHGESDKPHTTPGYGHDEMAGDVIAVWMLQVSRRRLSWAIRWAASSPFNS